MSEISGKILEIRLDTNFQKQAVISVSNKFIPKPGQYLKVYSPTDEDAPLSSTIFPSQYFKDKDKFVSAAPIPSTWQPGTELILSGPFGNGFIIKESVQRLGLISLSKSPDRILSLVEFALQNKIELALFTDSKLPQLSNQIEVNPLSAAENGLSWADMIAIDSLALPYEEVFLKLGLEPNASHFCPTQILLHLPMPCSGLGECGVCTIKGINYKSLLACEDGPVFKLTHKGFQKNE